MANKRAFSLSVVDSDAFLGMGVGCQLLYFHLALRSDDDGFCNSPRKIMRMIGANDDDIKVLIAKKFILPFESGVVVIKHWKLHNAIRKDMYHETNYTDEKSMLTEDEKGIYHMSVTNSLQPCNEPVTQSNINQSNINKNNITHHFDEFWSEYPKKVEKKKAMAVFNKINPDDDLFSTMIEAIKKQKQSDQWQRGFVPNPTTWLNGERWNDDIPKAPQASPTKKYGDYLQREPVKNDRFGMEYLLERDDD